jgi:hypothetical protein
MAHTPGPWEARRNPAWSKDVDIGQVGKFQNLAFVSSLNEDDARLIAAAPDLLEALKECYKVLTLEKVFNPDYGWGDFVENTILPIIQKAEGKD